VGAAAAVKQMHERGILASGDTLQYAFGLEIDSYRGVKRVWHGGDGDGYRAHAGRLPDLDVGVIVLTNLDELRAYTKATELYDLFVEPAEAALKGTVPAQGTEPVKPDTLLLDALAGYYRMKPPESYYKNEELGFERDGNILMLRPPGGGEVPLLATSDTTFRVTGIAVEMTFHVGPDRSVPSVTVHFPDEDRVADRFDPVATELPRERLPDYTGVYYSPEIDTEYRLFAENGKLIASPPSGGDLALTPTHPDAFDTDRSYFKWVRFERNESGAVIGFRVTNGNERVRNLWFEKMD